MALCPVDSPAEEQEDSPAVDSPAEVHFSTIFALQKGKVFEVGVTQPHSPLDSPSILFLYKRT